ncbi:MAG: MerR family transcriptional regulator [Candidatus Gracilibacteria bacterium]
MESWNIGTLAKILGISVRTLHHYEQIGLLSSTKRGQNNYRIYNKENLAELQKIICLKYLGYSLKDIKSMLQDTRHTPLAIIDTSLEKVEKEISVRKELSLKLSHLKRFMQQHQDISPEEFISFIYFMNTMQDHYTEEEMDFFEKRRKEVGEERIKEVENAWPILIQKVKDAMKKGLDPKDPYVQTLATQWKGLVAEFTGGNIQIENKVKNLYEKSYEQNTQVYEGAPTKEMMEFIGKAMQ